MMCIVISDHLKYLETKKETIKVAGTVQTLQHQKGAESRVKSRQVKLEATGGNGTFDH